MLQQNNTEIAITKTQEAFELQNRIEAVNQNITTLMFEMARLLIVMRDGEYWRHLPDEDGQPFRSFDRWLRSLTTVGYSTARRAIQGYEIWVLEFNVDVSELRKVAPSKFVELNPIGQNLLKEGGDRSEAGAIIAFAQDATRADIRIQKSEKKGLLLWDGVLMWDELPDRVRGNFDHDPENRPIFVRIRQEGTTK